MGLKELQITTEAQRLARFYSERTVFNVDTAGLWDETVFPKRPEVVVVDPGIANGLAIVHRDAVVLSELPPVEATHFLTAKDRTPYTLAVERPLHGAVRVYDPTPWQVYGLLKYHTEAWHPTTRWIDADVNWLQAGRHIAGIKAPSFVSIHAKDAFYHLNFLVAQERLTNV